MDNHCRRGRRRQSTAVAPMLVMILIVAACSSSDDDASPATTAPPPVATTTTATTAAQVTTATPVTTQPLTTTTAPVVTVDEALAVKDAYIEAYNAGDADAVLALFEPDPRMSQGTLVRDLVTFERYVAWSIAQGTTVTASDCTANELEDAVRLSCDSTRHQHLAVAVGAPAPQGILTLIVSADGIRRFAEANSPSDFAVVNVPFDRWLAENHPEDFKTRIGFGAWDSVAEAQQAGVLRGRYADEWAVYLVANGCTYLDAC